MKHVVAIALAAVSLGVTGIARAESATVISLDKIITGGYGGPTIRHMPIDGEDRRSIGIRGGIMLGPNLSIGLQAGTVLSPDNGEKQVGGDDTSKNSKLEMAHFGPYAALSLFPNWVVHPIASLSYSQSVSTVDSKDADIFDMFLPEAGIEINAWTHARVALTAGRRYVRGVQFREKKNADFEGITYGVAVSFGSF